MGSPLGRYRTEPIVYPWLAVVIAFGRPALIPWTRVLVDWAARDPAPA